MLMEPKSLTSSATLYLRRKSYFCDDTFPGSVYPPVLSLNQPNLLQEGNILMDVLVIPVQLFRERPHAGEP
jgi:hypothetical protein